MLCRLAAQMLFYFVPSKKRIVMINKFSIENFKVFNERTDFELAPITLLTGPNNSGKSSLTKGLAALLSSQRDDVFKGIDLHSPVIPLGEFNLIKNKKSSHQNIKMTLKMSGDNQFEFCFWFGHWDSVMEFAELDQYAQLVNLEIIYDNKVLVNIDNEIGGNTMFGIKINFNNTLEYLRKKNCSAADKLYKLLEKYSLQIVMPCCTFDRNKTKGFSPPFTDIMIDFLLNFDPERGSHKTKCKLDKKLFTQFVDPYKNKINNIKDYDEIIFLMEKFYRKTMKIVGNCIEDIRYNANGLRYIPINRGGTKRNFQFNSNDTLIERIINYLIISVEYNFRNVINEIYDDKLHRFNEKWLNYFSIGKEISIKKQEAPNYNIIIKDYHNELIPINDLGHGVTGLITLLFGLRELDLGGFCVIEEPESNLHPAFQSKLADLFAAVTKNIKHQLLIETHSEYMIRKFQYLVAQKELKPEDIVIYYFNDPNNIPEGEEHVKKITIGIDGSLSDNFGAGFFDEATSLKIDLVRLKNCH